MAVWLVSLSGISQDRYMVFFTDKDGTPYSTSNPAEFLSQRSLDRRAEQNIAITSMDLPVNPGYVADLAEEDVEVFFTTKWMNGALVQMEASQESTIENLTFVESIQYVGPGSKLSKDQEDVVIAENFTDPAESPYTTGNQLQMLGADIMHERGWKGEGTLIAVFDGGFTGVNLYSPFQTLHDEGRILAVKDYVENSGNPYQYSDHGTRVLSCIAGEYNNQFAGTAPEAEFVLAVTEDAPFEAEHRIEEYNWLFAAEFADSIGADVINSSLGYTTFEDASMDYTNADMDGQTTVITRAANWVADRGILVVNSAGNSGNGSWQIIGAPADSPKVLAVTAVDENEERVSFSSIGPSADGRTKPDVAAKGGLTTVVSGTGAITVSNGTSFASPVMAGFAASVWSGIDTLTNFELAELLKSSGHRADNPNNFLGYGIPNFLTILNAQDEDPILGVNIFPNPTLNNFQVSNEKRYELEIRLLDVNGRELLKNSIRESSYLIDISMYPKGLYLVAIRYGDKIETFKLRKN